MNNFLEITRLYKKFNTNKNIKEKYILCFHKEVNAFCLFEKENLPHIINSEKIDVLCIPENST